MVGSYVGLLARRYEGKLDASADKYIAFAVDGANRMQALIQDLLAYARAGTQAVQKEPVSSQDVLSKALKNLEMAIRDSSAHVHHNALPMVEADEMKLTQVLQNLIANAIKFAKPDSRPEIDIMAREAPSEWLFSVSDKGIGFDPKYSGRIFQVFQRLHGPGQYSGNGIGLAICRRIIEHHGGRMWAESELGIGSNFFFTLPVSRPRENRGSRRQRSELESVRGTAG
jgi:light-regulated signal transduction histidine kinase (bacteriophytochrome)